jgi:hypothetical protein
MSLRRPRLSAPVLACFLALPGLPGLAVAEVANVWWETSPATTPATANAVAVDPDGNVYVGGTMRPGGATGSAVAVLRRYSRGGGLVWTVLATGTLTSSWYEQSVRGVAIMRTSATTWDVVVAGVLSNTTSVQDLWAARLTTSGATVWSVTQDPSVGGSDGANAVAVTPAGNVVVAGWAGVQMQLALFQGGGGAPLDSGSFSDLSSLPEAALAVAVDAAGSVYIGGYFNQAGLGQRTVVAKFPAVVPSYGSGRIWETPLSAAWTATAYVGGLAVDASAGALYAVGAVSSDATQRDILSARLTLDGTVVWTATIDGGAGLRDEADACAVAANGDVLVAGSLTPLSSTLADVWVARTSPAGTALWQVTRNGPGRQVDGGLGVAVAPQGDVLVAGYEAAAGAGALPRFYLAALRMSSTGIVVATGSSVPHATPNPFRPGRGGAYDASAITFRALPAGSAVRIYSLAGELVAELKDDDRDGLVTWPAKNASGKDAVSGVYLFIVAPEHGASTRGKIVIVR